MPKTRLSASAAAIIFLATLALGCGSSSSTPTPTPTPYFEVFESTRFTVRDASSIAFNGTDAIFTEVFPDQAFLEFPLEFMGDSIPVVVNFRTRDNSAGVNDPVPRDFKVWVYNANGQQDVSDWDQGVEVATITRQTRDFANNNDVVSHSVDITNEVLDLIIAGATHIGVRFTGPSGGDQWWIDSDMPTIDAGPKPAP